MGKFTRELESRTPDGALLELLLSADPATLTAEEKLIAIVLAHKLKAVIEYVELVLLRSFDDTTEVAMAIKETEQSVARRKDLTDILDVLPRLADLVRQGDLDLRRLDTVRQRVKNLPGHEAITQVEDALLDVAADLNTTELARKTTKLVNHIDPLGAEQRHQKAKVERRVEFRPLPEGMAELRATLPAPEARLIYNQLTADARTLHDDRTTDQKRADAFVDRMAGKTSNRKVEVHVTIPMETLIGLTEDPGLLEGYGPIPATMARELAAQGPWRGILLDKYRTATHISTKRYRPPDIMREYIGIRDGGICTAPGATTPSNNSTT